MYTHTPSEFHIVILTHRQKKPYSSATYEYSYFALAI